MKKILTAILISSISLLSACQGIKIHEDKPVVAEIYLVHSKLKAYETFPDNVSRDWPSDYSIEQVLETFPEGAEPHIVHHTKLSTNWGKFGSVEEVNFLDATKWDVNNREWIPKVKEKLVTSSFKFQMTPRHYEDGSLFAEMMYTMEFLRGIEKVEDKDIYYPRTDLIKTAKAIQFIPNKFYVFEANALENKSSLIVLYKLKNE